jgi:hypothetical protein
MVISEAVALQDIAGISVSQTVPVTTQCNWLIDRPSATECETEFIHNLNVNEPRISEFKITVPWTANQER